MDRFVSHFTNRLDSKGHPYFHQVSNLRVSAHFLIRRDGDREVAKVDHIVMTSAWGSIPTEATMQSLKLIADKVLPKVA